MYAMSDGVSRDAIQAHLWLNLAASRKDEVAKEKLRELEREMTFEQKGEAMKRARGFAPKEREVLSRLSLVEAYAASLENEAKESRKDVVPPEEVDTIDPRVVLAEKPKGSGSGTIVSKTGYILTAAHVVKEASRLKVVVGGKVLEARVADIDTANDLALIKTAGEDFTYLRIGDPRSVKLGQSVATIGYPNIGLQGLSPKVTRGEISSLKGFSDDPREWQVSVPVQPGNSGGPLLGNDGRVVGVILSKLGLSAALITSGSLPENVNYAVKISYAIPLLEPFLGTEKAGAEKQGKDMSFEDMISKAKKAIVLILVY
jgi:S1-C subfamily serine protease